MTGPLNDALTPDSVINNLSTNYFSRIDVYEQVVSTNTLLREIAAALPDRSVAIASEQTGGRGRHGHSFFSPAGTGLYLSMLLRPGMSAEMTAELTTAAAVAVCQAIERTLGLEPWIKWVNDVFLGSRKVCGILTEAVSAPAAANGSELPAAIPGDTAGRTSGAHESAFGIDCAIVGIGINVYEPEGGFPPEIASVAGALTSQRQQGLRGRLAAALLDSFGAVYSDMTSGGGYIEEYRRRCGVIGCDITVISTAGDYSARAVGIDERCHLLIELADGTRRTLSSGEISIRLKDR